LKHLKQFVEYHTGLSTRIGFPTEYLVKETKEELKNPIFATGVGLIIKGYDYLREQGLLTLIDNEINEPEVVIQPTVKKVIATLPQEEEIDLDFDTEEVESTVEIKQDLVNEVPIKPRKRNWWDKLVDNTNEWFGDERVNSDNDFK
jgi:cell division protein FtsA